MASREIVAAFVKLIQQDVCSGALSGDRADSADGTPHHHHLLVAIQCLKDIYSVGDEQIKVAGHLVMGPVAAAASSVSAADRKKADDLKSKGNEHLTAKRFTDAISAYTQAIALDPNNAVYYGNRAAAYASVEKHEDAVADAKRAVEINPGYAKGYSRLGASMYAMGRWEEAVQAYEQALRIEPESGATKSSLDAARKQSEKASNRGSASSPLDNIDFSKLANNPALMSMASQLMQSGALKDLMNNPAAKQMMQSMMAGKGAPSPTSSAREDELDE